MWRGLAIRFVLSLYPGHLRERYGDEIAGLLHRSHTPVRDLANVALCATAEHGGTLSMPQLGKASARVAGLAALPLAVVVLWAAAMSAGMVAGAVVTGGHEGIWFYVPAFAVPAMLVLPLASW